MPPDIDRTVSGAPDIDQDVPDSHNSGRDRFLSRKIQGTYQHPQIRSLVARHCEQLSSGLVDVFRTEVEREVKQRVSEVIVSEATVVCEQLRLKEEALLAAEARCDDLQGQLELCNRMCSQLQDKIKKLEATEAELRTSLNRRLSEDPPFDSRHLVVVYERRDNTMLCRLCVDGRSKDDTIPVISFKEDVKLSTLAWHIQYQHPQEYDALLKMGEQELREVAREMSQVGD